MPVQCGHIMILWSGVTATELYICGSMPCHYTITLLTFPCPGEEPERGAGHGEEPRGGGPGQQGGQRSPNHAEGRGPQPGEN